jgi:D-cysteine desulfhydrase family pyridoxal phosphate-dependent enzyme
MLKSFPRIHLGKFPTPLQEAPKLANYLGVSKLYIKRDDETGLAFGGNKVRKLEYDLAEIIKNSYDTIITVGGTQSNHARLTAAAARKLGLDIKLVLGGPDFTEPQGNLLLDILFNSEVRYLLNDDSEASLNKMMLEWKEELEKEGKNPATIPIGGSTPLGSLGYVNAIKELQTQYGDEEVQLVVPIGSCGTYSGLVLGSKLFMPHAKIFGISVSRTSIDIEKTTLKIIEGSSKLLGIDNPVKSIDLKSFDCYYGQYGESTKEGIESIKLCASLEGILLDPIYTGKSMAGLIDLVQNGELKKDIPIIFIHTGGIPILYQFNKYFSDYADITKY